MDNIDNAKIFKWIYKCTHLKFLFFGVFPTDSFPKLFAYSFVVVNVSKAGTTGIHWLLICKKTDQIFSADPLGNSLEIYFGVYKPLNSFSGEVIQLCTLMPFLRTNSKLCGMFWIYIAHVIVRNKYPFRMYLNDDDLLRFAKHML